MPEKRSYGGLDAFKLLAAMLVIAIHTSPLASYSVGADFFLTRILSRLAVPFFFMVTGQFILSSFMNDTKSSFAAVWRYIKKVLCLYGISILIYIPIGTYAGHYKDIRPFLLLRMLVFDGTFYHLWYFPALILGILLLCLLRRALPVPAVFVIAVFLYLIGLLGDSYYGLIAGVSPVSAIYAWGFNIFTYTRNGLFFAPLFLLMGACISHTGIKKPLPNLAGFILFFIIMAAEGFTLRHLCLQRHDSMYLSLPFCIYFLYRLLCRDRKAKKFCRKTATWIYILHPAMIIAVRGAAKALHLTELLIDNSLLHYTAVCILSFVLAACITTMITYFTKKPLCKNRAWIEIDCNALQHNIAVLRAILPKNCALMPVLKANAYGHGAVPIAKELKKLEINAFCVACVEEGIELRKNGIKGEILILGYTHPGQFHNLCRYKLTQTVIDLAYADELNHYGKKISVHIGIDTGMHRLGESNENIEPLCTIFQMKNLKITGAYTHLCTANTDDVESKTFTQKQAQIFYRVCNAWKERGLCCPKLHLQASYGVLNYPEFAGDFARVGIALYGVLSAEHDYNKVKASLQPVLSLHARIAAIKELCPGETAGYNFAFTAERPTKIAVLSIGYADGLPRALSCGAGAVLINGRRAPIIGRVCMDQTTVDITNIPDVHRGDIATLIGKSGNSCISAYALAEQTDTITNEILSRLGARLERIYHP